MVDLAIEARERIRAALPPPERGGFEAHAAQLLDALGYRSDLALPGQDGSADWFFANVGRDIPVAKAEREFRDHAASVRILFQVTDDEIRQSAQPMLMEGGAFNPGNARSFIFAAVELTGDGYTRGRYAEFTRVINKRVNAPCVVLFRNAKDRVSLAFVHRRPNKRDPKRAVLGSVSLVREVDAANPHRAHVDILADLSLDERLRWMDAHAKPHDFDGLMAAWLDALDTEALNKRFYRELFRWFQRAVDTARFPVGDRLPTAEDHAIRLITRMLFIWFVKEKDLVAEELFVQPRIEPLLKGYDAANGDSYYRAVLQNLFFATLNTEIPRRGFSARTNATHRDFTRYRYAAEIADRERLLALFAQTPFINGGLFDCLDSEEAAEAGGVRIDYFTDNVLRKGADDYAKLSVPNRLFFDDGGLIALFNRYKFTVEENTPAEQEVALDPELLGRVFENLLAAVNPETRETVRKQTGSYYTPRPVVDYMVDEALTAALAASVPPTDGDARFLEERLRYLLDYSAAFEDAAELFDDGETERVIEAIADLRVLDPAVGSGAFPMGVLHKLTLALRRLDPDNQRWEELQKERARKQSAAAYDIDDRNRRDAAQREISALFERYRDSDFGRKLYLIQNSIYGVDIQAVATQIAKLRFFISLAIEQRQDRRRKNYGIRPLPNLETRFVAADTLRGLARSPQLALRSPAVEQLERELAANRERHFHAGDRKTKLSLRKADARLRARLSKVLREGGLPAPSAESIAAWDPYDQNASAAWFDPEYMFNVADGFDVVIANPPYVQLQRDGGNLANLYRDAGYKTFARSGDIYYLFYEKGVNLLRDGASLCFISSNQWMRVDSANGLRQFIGGHNPKLLVNLGAERFDSVTVNTCVLLVNRSPNGDVLQVADVRHTANPFPPEQWAHVRPANGEPWAILEGDQQSIKAKMESIGTPLEEWDSININYGIKTGYNPAFIIDTLTRDALIAQDPKSAGIIKPILRGRDIHRYNARWAGLWLINIPWHFPLHLDSSIKGVSNKAEILFAKQYSAIYQHLLSHKPALLTRNKAETGVRYEWYALQRWAASYYKEFEKKKIVWGNLNNHAKFAYAPEGTFINAPTTLLTPYSPYLLALLNSALVDWYFKQIGVERDGGYFEYKPMFIGRLPIPQASEAEQAPFVALVDEILAAKARDPHADTSAQEAEIDRLVYALYHLTAAEIAAVAG